MPYIGLSKDFYKTGLDELLDMLDEMSITVKEGHLTYIITELLQRAYFENDEYSFNSLSDCIKILECAKLEFYRKAVAPYEDIKARENGEVYYDMDSELGHRIPSNK